MKLRFLILPLFISFSFQFAAAQDELDSIYFQGVVAIQNFQFDEALDYFFECQRNDPFNPEYLSKMGFCYFQLGNLQEARTYFLEVLKLDAEHLSTLNYLSTIEEQMLNYHSALMRMEDLISLDTTNSYYFRSAGSLAEKVGEIPLAMGYFTKALELNPNDQNALLSLCDLYSKGGHLEIADSMLTSALYKQPKNLRLLYRSAAMKYKMREYQEVQPLFESALELGDTNLRYLPLLAFSLAQQERCEEAIPWMEYLVERVDPDEQLHYFLGFCYWKIEKDAVKSIEHFDLAIELGLSPNLGVYYQRIGDVKLVENKHRSALKNYELALNYGNEDPEIHFHMAVAFDHIYLKDKKRPLEGYKKYLAQYNGKNKEFKAYAQKRVEEIEYYENEIWKGN